MGLSADIARQYCERFPKTPSKTLANKMYKENDAAYVTFDAAYCAIRRVRGNQGDNSRKRTTDKSKYQPNGKAGEVRFKLPEGKTEVEGWDFEPIDIPGHWLLMNDLHFPFHKHKLIEACLVAAEHRKVAGILLNGDVMDCHAISQFHKDPRERDFGEELETVQEFFGHLRQRFKKTRIVFKLGNHEERFTKFMEIKAAELLDIPEFQFDELTHANKHGLQIVKDKRPIMLGKLMVYHGHELAGGSGSPASPARSLRLKTNKSGICGHWHRISNDSDPDVLGHVATCWSIGCLCDTHPRYMPLNKWGHGAAFVHVGKDGSFDVNNFRIINGKIYS